MARLILPEQQALSLLPGGPGRSYGASQLLLPGRLPRANGCCAAAACNLLAFLAPRRADLRPLLPPPEQSPGLLEEMYALFHPGLLGYRSLKGFGVTLRAWAGERGASLEAELCPVKRGEAACRRFLQDALADGRPAAALSLRWSLFRGDPFDWHWVTVTGWEDRDDRSFLVLSSWGSKHRLDWEQYYARIRRGFPGGGFVSLK